MESHLKNKNMKEKQVILLKSEFDSMEEELNNLRKVVEDKTISIIKTPNLNWNGGYGYVDSYIQQYVFGVKESQVINDLKEELERVRKETEEYKQRVFLLDREVWRLKDESTSWKNLPWYKRLFLI